MTQARRKEGPCAPLFFSAAALLLLSARMTAAQTVDLSSLEICANLETPELKLACFDAIIATGRTSGEQAPADGATIVLEHAPVVVDPEPYAANVGTTPGARESVAMAPAALGDDVGQKHLNDSEQPEKKIIRATVTEVSQGYNKILYFHLANGHVWRQIEARHLQYPKGRDFEINITQGMFGAYRLRIGDDGRMVAIRRVK